MKEPPEQRPQAEHALQREQRARDQRCIREVLAGNSDAYRHLVSSYKDRVFSLTLRMVGDRSVAEELTQEIFVKAYSNLASFRFEAAVGTWLTRICLNHVNNYFDSRSYSQRRSTVPFDPARHDQTAEESSAAPALLSAFRAALEDIKPCYRDVLVICVLEDKSYEEASTMLGIPVGTVRSRLNRARQQMKQLLETLLGAP